MEASLRLIDRGGGGKATVRREEEGWAGNTRPGASPAAGGDEELGAVPEGRVAVSPPGSGAAAQGDGRDLPPGPRGCFSA